MINTDLCIIGSGPVSLFAVFEAGQFDMRCHLIDGRREGNVLMSSFQQEPLSDLLMDIIKVYQPSFSTGEWVEHVDQDENGYYLVMTNKKTQICCKSLLIAEEDD